MTKMIGFVLALVGLLIAFCLDFYWDSQPGFYHENMKFRMSVVLTGISGWLLMIAAVSQ